MAAIWSRPQCVNHTSVYIRDVILIIIVPVDLLAYYSVKPSAGAITNYKFANIFHEISLDICDSK